MTKVSASTLARRAAKTKNAAEAKRLRAQSAKMRREERMAKNKPRPAAKILKGLQQALEHTENMTAQGINQALYGDSASNAIARAASIDSMPLTQGYSEYPGCGEIVGGYLATMADTIAKMARKKGGVDDIQGRLMTLEHQTRHDAMFDARQRERKAVQAVREEMRDKSICGFIALVDAATNTKSMAMVSLISAEMISHIVDALKANGYHADGKR